MHYSELIFAGVGIGMIFGVFGAGGSAFATPVLAMLGVPALVAVASPLPAMLPASLAAARLHLRAGKVDTRVAKLTVLGAAPGTIVGALAATAVGGTRLLVASGAMLLTVGIRLILPDGAGHQRRCDQRRDHGRIVVAASFGIGVLTGLLANGGGFLLVPLFVLLLGLPAGDAAGTSLVAVGVLTVPTIATHWYLGHIDWRLAGIFAVGAVPGSVAGARIAQRLATARARQAFGFMLVTFAAWFLARELFWR